MSLLTPEAFPDFPVRSGRGGGGRDRERKKKGERERERERKRERDIDRERCVKKCVNIIWHSCF